MEPKQESLWWTTTPAGEDEQAGGRRIILGTASSGGLHLARIQAREEWEMEARVNKRGAYSWLTETNCWSVTKTAWPQQEG